MISLFRLSVIGLLALGLAKDGAAADSHAKGVGQSLWITAYYPGWQQTTLPPGEIDFRALTHLVQFSVLPQANGRLDWAKHGLDEKHIKDTVRITHAAGRKILLCVGGADSAPAFRAVLKDGKRAGFVKVLVEAARSHGYDGLDIDMEPMEARDAVIYAAFIRELRAALHLWNSSALLTAAAGELPSTFAGLQGQFDQINLMTYDLSGTWEGWVTWHNSALRNSGLKFPGVDRELPSVDLKIREWLSAGISPGKLGLGVAFYGYVWSGASAPQQPIKGVKTVDISYADLMRTYFKPERYQWDDTAQVPYLSVGADGAKRRAFISYDDDRSVRLKIDYAVEMKLGGAIIWELGSGYRRELPAGQRDPLLQAVRRAAFGQ